MTVCSTLEEEEEEERRAKRRSGVRHLPFSRDADTCHSFYRMNMLETAYIASPVAVDVPSFDPLWPTHEEDFFPEMAAMAIKQSDLHLTVITSAAPDEDAWLFNSDKLGVKLGAFDVEVTAAEPQAINYQAPLTIEVPAEVHHDDEDTTNVLLQPTMGSPVDELDAMTAFMVDHVDPFQEVVLTSDDEPMSPASSPLRNGRCMSNGALALAEERRLAKLRASVAHLEKMYCTRCHGRALASNDSMDVNRIKLVRSLERLQRVACNIARENFAFRAGKMAQRVCEEMLLHDMGCALKGVVMNEQIEKSVANKLCSNAIVNTARLAAEAAAMGLSSNSADEIMGWKSVKHYEPCSGLISFIFKKELTLESATQFQTVTSQSWDLLLSSEQFAAFMKNGSSKTIRSHVIKRLGEDALLVAFDAVVADTERGSACVERDVCVTFRVRSATGMLVGISSMPPSLFQSSVPPLDGIQFVENGMRWMQLSSAAMQTASGADHVTVVAGGRTQCPTRAAAEAALLGSMGLVMQWERQLVAPAFAL